MSKTTKRITILTIPLLWYHNEIVWGVYTLYTGQPRAEIKKAAHAGLQITDAFCKASQSDTDILIVVDDKFTKLDTGHVITQEMIDLFIFNTKELIEHFLAKLNLLPRILRPQGETSFTDWSFSEQKLLELSRPTYGFAGECDNEWAYLLESIESLGYASVDACIPRVCYAGVCYGTQMSVGMGFKLPVSIAFTSNKADTQVFALNQT